MNSTVTVCALVDNDLKDKTAVFVALSPDICPAVKSDDSDINAPPQQSEPEGSVDDNGSPILTVVSVVPAVGVTNNLPDTWIMLSFAMYLKSPTVDEETLATFVNAGENSAPDDSGANTAHS